MVGVEMTDQDRVQRPRIEQPGEAWKRTLPEVQEERRGAVADQVSGPRRTESIGVGGSGADDVKAQCAGARFHAHAESVPAPVPGQSPWDPPPPLPGGVGGGPPRGVWSGFGVDSALGVGWGFGVGCGLGVGSAGSGVGLFGFGV